MSEVRTPSTGADQHGATPVSGERRGGRRKGLLFGALLVAALLALALLLSQCMGSDPSGETGAAGNSSSAADPSDTSGSDSDSDSGSDSGSGAGSEPQSGSGAGSGTASGGTASGGTGATGQGTIVTAGGASILDLAAGGDAAAALGGISGQQVTATGVRVLSVPADEGFWVGSSDTQRVWVQLTGEAGESPYQVKEGDVIDFQGTVTAHDPSFTGQVGVDEAEGAGQLADQGQHLEAAKSAVRLSR